MFKNRSIQLSVVKTPNTPTDTTEEPKPFMSSDDAKIVKYMIRDTALAVVAVMAVSVVLHTASQIVINAMDTDNE